MFSEKLYWTTIAPWHCLTLLFSYRLCENEWQTQKVHHSTADFLTASHTHTYTHPSFLARSPPPPPTLSLSFWHPSLSVAMDCETNFYHYTLQVKKGSWECVIYAGFDFYVVSTGSSIIAPLAALVHRAPDEMLSRHRYQSPCTCSSPVPGVQGGGMCCSCRTPLPPLLPATRSPALRPPPRLHDGVANTHSHLSFEWWRVEHAFWMWDLPPLRDHCSSDWAIIVRATWETPLTHARTLGSERFGKHEVLTLYEMRVNPKCLAS